MSSAKSTESATGRAGWAALLPAGFHVGWTLASYVLVATVIWLSLAPVEARAAVGGLDKWGHALAYGVLATWFMGFHPRGRLWRVAGWLFVFGATLEVAQASMRIGRTGELADLLANTLGIGIGATLSVLTAGWPRRVENWLGRA
jgi:VanZ family protein